MYMTVSLMVIDTQDTLAVQKHAFPATGRSLHCFSHRYSFIGRTPNKKAAKVSCLPLGPEDFLIFSVVLSIPHYWALSNNLLLRAYPNNLVVMRLSEKPEAKTAGQKRSEAWFVPRPERFWPTTQASGFAASRNRLGYWDRL